MAIYDRRAQRGQELLGHRPPTSRGRYGRYMHPVEELLDQAHQHNLCRSKSRRAWSGHCSEAVGIMIL
jgi:hypothetical protein